MRLADRGIAIKGEESTDPALTPLQVRVRQCWTLEGKALGVTGFTPDRAEYLESTKAQDIILPGVELTVDPSDGHRRYDLSIPLSDLTLSRILVELVPDQITTERTILPSDTGLEIVGVDPYF